MYEIQQQNYTIEFKREAVQQVEEEGRQMAWVARKLCIAEQTLINWRKAAKAGKLVNSSDGFVTLSHCKNFVGELKSLD